MVFRFRARPYVYLLPKQLGEQVAKLQVRALWEREFMALVRAQVKALDFKRSYGIVKRSLDLLPVRPCRLQADNNDAHLLQESWMRIWPVSSSFCIPVEVNMDVVVSFSAAVGRKQ